MNAFILWFEQYPQDPEDSPRFEGAFFGDKADEAIDAGRTLYGQLQEAGELPYPESCITVTAYPANTTFDPTCRDPRGFHVWTICEESGETDLRAETLLQVMRERGYEDKTLTP